MPEDKKLIFKTALMHFQEGRWERTITEFKRLVALDPDDLNSRNILADAYVKIGSLKEAFAEYANAAEGYLKKGGGEKAKVIHKKMAKLDSSTLDEAQQQRHLAISLVVRGDSVFEQGEYEEAAQAYQEVAQADPKNMEVVAKLAETYARLGKNQEAAPYCLTVAQYYLENRLFKRALVYFQKVTELDPANMDARLELGELLAREGQELESRREFEAVAKHFIDHGDLERAQGCCQKAIQHKSIDAHYLLGEIFIRQEKYDEARSELEDFLKIKANHIPAQYSLGMCLVSKGLQDEALGAFGKILGKQPDHVESLERMAEIYGQKGAAADAIVQLLSLAAVFMGQKIMDRAEQSIRKALALDSQHIDAHKRLAELYELRGMKREAADEYLVARSAAKAKNLAAEAAACEEKIRAIDPSLLGTPPPVAAGPGAEVEAAPAVAPIEPAPDVVPIAPAPAVAPIELATPSLSSPPPAPPIAEFAPASPAPQPVVPTPPKPRTVLTPEKRAQRLMSMAQSALKQNLYDEALDILQQAQQLLPDDQELKATVQTVLRKYAQGAKPVKKIEAQPPPAVAEPTAAPAKVSAAGAAGPAPSAAAGADAVTPTLASLYFSQGHLAEALRMYRVLIGGEPHSVEYQQRIAAIKQRLAAGEPAVGQTAPSVEVPALPVERLPAIPPSERAPVAPVLAKARPRVSYV